MKESYVDTRVAVGSGYGESKWVCEKILKAAKANTPLKPTTIRIGQMSGISTNGFWTEKEWVPSLIRSSIDLGALPLLSGVWFRYRFYSLPTLTEFAL